MSFCTGRVNSGSPRCQPMGAICGRVTVHDVRAWADGIVQTYGHILAGAIDLQSGRRDLNSGPLVPQRSATSATLNDDPLRSPAGFVGVCGCPPPFESHDCASGSWDVWPTIGPRFGAFLATRPLARHRGRVIVYAVVVDAISPGLPLGDSLEVFVRGNSTAPRA
jgi:hypothetical protein